MIQVEKYGEEMGLACIRFYPDIYVEKLFQNGHFFGCSSNEVTPSYFSYVVSILLAHLVTNTH
jgi:hypothetical protein